MYRSSSSIQIRIFDLWITRENFFSKWNFNETSNKIFIYYEEWDLFDGLGGRQMIS